MATATLTPNAPLAYRTLDHLDANPLLLDQAHYCLPMGSEIRACFMGRTLLLEGIRISNRGEVLMDDVSPELADAVLAQQMDRYLSVDDRYPLAYIDAGEVAEALLGLTSEQAGKLINPNNTLMDLHRLVAEIFGPRPKSDDGTLTMTPAEIAAELAVDRLALPQPPMVELDVATDIVNTPGGNR